VHPAAQDLDTRIALVQEWITADPGRAPFVIEAWRIGVIMGADWVVTALLLTPLPESPFTAPLP
jgi:hypothetical protein